MMFEAGVIGVRRLGKGIFVLASGCRQQTPPNFRFSIFKSLIENYLLDELEKKSFFLVY